MSKEGEGASVSRRKEGGMGKEGKEGEGGAEAKGWGGLRKGNKRREGGGGRRNEGGHRESRVSLNIRSSLLQRCETDNSSYHRSFV